VNADPSVIPGLLLLAGELIALALVGFIVARVALRQMDDRLALAQGLVVGLALWGLIVNFVLYLWPGSGGALVGWAAVLAIGAGLAWRGRKRLSLKPRVATGIGTAFLVVFWIALAARQLLGTPDRDLHHGLIAAIRAGGAHPPELPWNPGLSAPYHYGVDLLIGLLTPPIGPDPAFVTELLGAYIWASYALIVVTFLVWRGSWVAAVTLGPLLLAAGTQTYLFTSPGVVQVPVPAGLPAPGLRASLATVYVDGVTQIEAWPPNIWKPNFPLVYALALVVLERVMGRASDHWLLPVFLATLVGFLSLVDAVAAVAVLAVWSGLTVLKAVQAQRGGPTQWSAVGRTATGPVLAALLLGAAGGAISGVLVESSGTGLSLGWKQDTSLRQPVGTLTLLSGGLGLLGLGPLVLAIGAVVLAWRNRLVVALAACSGICLLGGLALQYEYAQHDVTRLDGHARNFAMLGVLLALGLRLGSWQPARRYAVGAVIVGLMTWPAVVLPVRALGPALRQGVELANAGAETRESRSPRAGQRDVFPRLRSERLADFVRNNTSDDARILSPRPTDLSGATGRPNASGFRQAAHYIYAVGPEYLDAIRFLSPSAVRSLGISYVHATDAWMAELPAHAQGWLDNPQLFEHLARDGADRIYRVQPAFLSLETEPAAGSYEALRRAVPAAAIVYLEPATEVGHALRIASALAQAQLVGELGPGHIHLRTDFGVEPLGERRPSFVVAPRWYTPSMFPPPARRPVWWNDWVAIYALEGLPDPIMSAATLAPAHVTVEVPDPRAEDGRAAFTLRLTNRSPDAWTGQDWLVLPARVGGLPVLPHMGRTEAALWFSGQIAPGHENTRLTYVFDPQSASLSVRAGDGSLSAAGGGGDALDPGRWTLALRLNRDVRHRGYVGQQAAAYIPVMHVDISQSREVSYTVYEGDLNAGLRT